MFVIFLRPAVSFPGVKEYLTQNGTMFSSSTWLQNVIPTLPTPINKFDGKKILEKIKFRKEQEKKEESEHLKEKEVLEIKKAVVTPESFKKEVNITQKWNAINRYSLQEVGKRHKIQSIFGETVASILGKEDFF